MAEFQLPRLRINMKEIETTVITSGKEVTLTPPTGLFAYFGRIMATASLAAGTIALLFSLAPFAIGWFAAIFWMLYPFCAICLVCAIPAYISRKIWMPTVGLMLALLSIVIAAFSGGFYVMAMAGSVNGLTHIAKSFVDALVWPFK